MKPFLPLVLLSGILVCGPAVGAVVAIDSTTNLIASAGSSYANGVGHRFQINSSNLAPGESLVVRQLGTDGYFAPGATSAGIVLKLWDASNATTPLATVTFTGAEAFTIVDYAHGSYDGRRYLGDIAPLTLTAGTTYLITAYGFNGTGNTQAAYINGAPGQTTAPQITFLQELYSTTAGAMPTVVDGAAGVYKYGGPTFTFDIVPEPSAALMIGLAAIGLLRRRR